MRSFRSLVFFLLKGFPALIFLSILSLAYLTLGAASFLQSRFGAPFDGLFIGFDKVSQLKLSIVLLFACHYFLYGTLKYILKIDVYEASCQEIIFLVRMIRFHQKYLEKYSTIRSLFHPEHVFTWELIALVSFIYRHDFAIIDEGRTSAGGWSFLYLLSCIPAFLCETWAFPLMVLYLSWRLEEIVDNDLGR